MPIGPVGVLLLGVAQDAATFGSLLAIRGARHYFGDWRDYVHGGLDEPSKEALELEFQEKRKAGLLSKAAVVLKTVSDNPDALTVLPEPKDEKGNPIPDKLLPGIYAFAKKAQWRKQVKGGL